ncbi:MAG: phosphotransferase [Proteobacteria bacterium]|nr:phosphotransferase [Pseudomonadota bacterium]
MKNEEQLIPVREAHRFDPAALTEYLAANLDGFTPPLTSVLQFEIGQSNPTFLLEAGGRKWVLRKKPPGKLLPSAHLVHREYRVMKALKDTAVPVPEMYHLCRDESVMGTDFFIMEYVDGILVTNPSLQNATPDQRRAILSDLIRVLAELHSVDYEAVGLADFGKPGNYFARQIAIWSKQYEASKTDDIPSMDRLMEYLPRNVPKDDTTCIAHGDYRLGNTLVHETEPRIAALLDWELCTLGHPLGDLAYLCQAYHASRGGPRTLSDLAGPETGIPTEEEYLEEYCRLTGRDGIPNWPFYLSFTFFRSAGITQGVYKRGLMGNASSARAKEIGRYTRTMADIAWSFIEKGR